jgi:hypothetical protein
MTQVLGSINLDGITDLQTLTKVDDRENPAQEEFVLTNCRCLAKRGDELRRVVPLNIVQ